MTTKKDKSKLMFEELGRCIIEQGHSIKIENKIYIDLRTILLFKEIIQKELNIDDKTFWNLRNYKKE